MTEVPKIQSRLSVEDVEAIHDYVQAQPPSRWVKEIEDDIARLVATLKLRKYERPTTYRVHRRDGTYFDVPADHVEPRWDSADGPNGS